MKICYLLNDFGVGGVSKVVYDIIKNINFNEVEISFVILKNDLEFLNQISLPEPINIYTFDYEFDPDYSLKRYFTLGYFFGITKKRAAKILDKIKEIDPDILHLHVLPRELAIGILARNQSKKIQLVYTDHLLRIADTDSTPLKRSLLAMVYRKLYQKYHVISVSKSVRKCQENYNWLNGNKRNLLMENRISLVDYPVLKSYNSKTIKIVYIARLSAVKGHFQLLEAWKEIEEDFAELILVGGGELEKELKTYVDKLNLGNVIFTGNVTNVKEHLLKASFAVFPSTKEGLPISLLEKMATGLPVVVSNIPELVDFIEDEKNGLVYQLGNKKELKEKIIRLIQNEEDRIKLGKNARATLVERFGKLSLTELTMNHYNAILNG